MKRMMVFILAGLLLGLGVGAFVSGSKERDLILAAREAEKAAAEARSEEEHADPSDPAAQSASEAGDGETHPASVGQDDGVQEDAGTPEPQASEDDGGAETGAGSGVQASEDTVPAAADGASENDEDPVPAEPVTTNAPARPGSTPSGFAGSKIPTGGSPEEGLQPEGPVRLAKIFGAMEPKDAAAVLQNLKDGEVKAILMNMSDRKVADILGEFEPERAATLSRIVLETRSGEQQ